MIPELRLPAPPVSAETRGADSATRRPLPTPQQGMAESAIMTELPLNPRPHSLVVPVYVFASPGGSAVKLEEPLPLGNGFCLQLAAGSGCYLQLGADWF